MPEKKLPQKLSRRDFLRIAAAGTAGAISVKIAEQLYRLLNSGNPPPEAAVKPIGGIKKDSVVPATKVNTAVKSTQAAINPEATRQNVPKIVIPQSEPTNTSQQSQSQAVKDPETTVQVEIPKEYEFRIGKVRLDRPFLMIIPNDISADPDNPKGLEVDISTPLANREKTGWPDSIIIPFEKYWEDEGTALVAQSDIPGHDVVILHSFIYKGHLLPGEVFRRVKDREGLKGKEFQIKQADDVLAMSRLRIVDVSQVPGEEFEDSDARPTNTTDPQKFVFFRSDMWNLKAGEKARQSNQVTFVTCDGRFVEDNVNKFATRLLITAELLPERPKKFIED